MHTPRVAIIVLNWNGLADTLECLESLFRMEYPPAAFEVVVVDNGSTGGDVAAIRQAYPQVRLIETGTNLGFAGGNNVGIRYALEQNVDYLFLLNNDTVVHQQTLTRLIDIAEAHPDVGIVSPKICYYAEPQRIWCAGAKIDWRAGATYRLQAEEIFTNDTEVAVPVDFVSGCAICVRRAVFEQVGLLDERYYLYYEEIDWCARIAQHGFGIFYVPQASIWHKVSQGHGAGSPNVAYYMTRNELLFFHEHLPRPQRWIVVSRIALRTLRTVLAFSLKPQYHHKRAQRDAHLRGLLDFARGRLGALGANL